MKNKQNLLLIAMMVTTWIVMWKFMPAQKQNVKLPDPKVLMTNAEKAVAKKDYKTAYKTYDEVTSKFGNTEDAAQALLLKARAMRDERNNKGQPNSEQAAVETYKTLAHNYDRSKFPQVNQAETEMQALRLKMDKENRTNWLYQTMAALVNFGMQLGLKGYSYAFALLLITLIVKALTWKLSVIQYKGMRDMQRVQPLLKEIQEKYKGQTAELNKRVMETYKKEGVNPLSGCLPILIQFPILIFVYQAIQKYAFQFENGIFFWINGATSAHHGWAISKLLTDIPVINAISHQSFIAKNLAEPDIPLVILYTISMFVTQRLTVVDPTQAQQQKIMSIMMPLMFMFLFWKLPSAFLLYWLMLNIVMTAHQYFVIKAPATAPATAQVIEATPTPSKSAGQKKKRKR